MYQSGPFDFIPLWLLIVFTVAFVYAAVEIGYRCGERRQQDKDREADAPVGAIVGATLGLLAFMLAFTFSLAGSRFEARRQVVLDEANAIGTTYLRAGMLAEPHRGEIRSLLREYVDMRISGIKAGNVDEVLNETQTYHERIWIKAEATVKDDRSPIAASFVSSLNEMIDLHATRVQAGLRSRIPLAIWLVLAFVTLVSMLAVGYQMGLTSKRRSFSSLALVLAFSSVILLIADLDRPGQGMLDVGQQATIDLLESMKQAS